MKTKVKSKVKTKKSQVTKVCEQEILVVKVGSDAHPAGPADLLAVQEALDQCSNDSHLILVTHHAIDFSVIKRKFLKNKKPVVKSTLPASYLHFETIPTGASHVEENWVGEQSATEDISEDYDSHNGVYGINN